jgi:hypothetical protein
MSLAFIHDTHRRRRMYKQDLSPHQHAMPLIVQFLAYVCNQHFERTLKELDAQVQQLVEKGKDRPSMFGEPTKGDLFAPEDA